MHMAERVIIAAEYQLLSKLPAKMTGKLPTAGQLADAVHSPLPGKKGRRS
jgi:hypothetical protein